MSIHTMNRNWDESPQKLTVKSVLPSKSTRRMSANDVRRRSVLIPTAATKALAGSLARLKNEKMCRLRTWIERSIRMYQNIKNLLQYSQRKRHPLL